ncbi:MAG: outer membrane lipoprotein-sorting protein [Myxococcales bacterium]|nr:outer membrane lipoprotein-sorting protein [Myxococcales bacterium]
MKSRAGQLISVWTTFAALTVVAPAVLWAQEGTGTAAEQPAEGAAGELSADEIVDRSLDTNTMGFQAGDVQLSVIIQDNHGDVRERRIRIRSREEDGQNRALVRILAPAEVAGQSYLFMENEGGEDDVWIYLPALDDEPRRVAGSQKDESFMGTNITYSDLESGDIRDAEYERHEDETIGGFPVYVIDATSADSTYSSVRMWIRQSDYIPLRIRFFGDGGVEEKTMFTEQVDTHQGRTYVRRMTVRDREDNATTLVVEAVDFEADIDLSEFTRENLVR